MARVVEWRPTKIMNMRDLSNDDDFISHLLVEKLGTGAVPLYVHKMDPTRRLPKTDAAQLLHIVRRVRCWSYLHIDGLIDGLTDLSQLVLSRSSLQNAVRHAIDELLLCVLLFLSLSTLLIPLNTVSLLFVTTSGHTPRSRSTLLPRAHSCFSLSLPHSFTYSHASRYFELYNPSGSIEIAHTSRYSHRSGKSELCILATRQLAPGTVITELKGSMANLTDQEDRDLKKAGLRSGDIRRDFSVIHSKSMKKNHLFLGPARFVNVGALSFSLSPSCSFSPTHPHSMTVTTTASSFAKAGTSPFVSSGPSMLARKLPPTMAMATVGPSL